MKKEIVITEKVEIIVEIENLTTGNKVRAQGEITTREIAVETETVEEIDLTETKKAVVVDKEASAQTITIQDRRHRRYENRAWHHGMWYAQRTVRANSPLRTSVSPFFWDPPRPLASPHSCDMVRVSLALTNLEADLIAECPTTSVVDQNSVSSTVVALHPATSAEAPPSECRGKDSSSLRQRMQPRFPLPGADLPPPWVCGDRYYQVIYGLVIAFPNCKNPPLDGAAGVTGLGEQPRPPASRGAPGRSLVLSHSIFNILLAVIRDRPS